MLLRRLRLIMGLGLLILTIWLVVGAGIGLVNFLGQQAENLINVVSDNPASNAEPTGAIVPFDDLSKPGTTRPGLNIAIATNYYQINGSDGKQLSPQLNHIDNTYAGRTNWNYNWSYQSYHAVKPTGSCQLSEVKVSLKVEFIMPQWVDRGGASDKLLKNWNIYYAKLQLHEDGHKDRAITTANNLLTGLTTTNFNCNTVSTEVHSLADKIIEEGKLAQNNYDQATK